jgi:sugar phosphate isomerase/epimerase
LIFASTGGFPHVPAWNTARSFIDNNITNIELSGGTFCSSQISELKKLASLASFQPHNYFPPPLKPFVLNLASLDDQIYDISLKHLINSIRISSELGSKYFSFHAGFLVDPMPSELGKKIQKRPLQDRYHSLSIFLDRVHELSKTASFYGVDLLLENNVLSHGVFSEFSCNPLLMVDEKESLYIAESIPSNISLLIDVAHLKVSSTTLNFDPVKFLQSLGSHIKAYHFSDNDGLSDSNSPFTRNSWFWPFIKKNLDYYSVEVYTPDLDILSRQLSLASELTS